MSITELPMDNARTAFANWVEDKEHFRAQKAEQYPEDERNARSRDGYRELHLYVANLPLSDERLQNLAMVHPDWLDVVSPGPESDRLGSKFRFHDSQEDPDQWVTTIVDAIVEEAVEAIED